MAAIGLMPMPENFKYACVCRRGKPRHELCDAFGIRHPRMDVGHRAKQFAPFAALRGFEHGLRDAETKAEEADREELCTPESEESFEEDP